MNYNKPLTGPLMDFLEFVSGEVEERWSGSTAPSMYGIALDGRIVSGSLQHEGQRDAPEAPDGWEQALEGVLRRQYGSLVARVAVVEGWATLLGQSRGGSSFGSRRPEGQATRNAQHHSRERQSVSRPPMDFGARRTGGDKTLGER